MGTEQSTANHSYSHNQLPPGGYSKPYSLTPNNYHSAGSASDLRHALSYGNLPSNIRSGMSQGLPSRPVKTEKTIFIVADNGKRVQVTFQISEEDNLTCGWLVSETIRQFADRKLQEPYPNRPIIALQTVDDIITMDYWLSDLERPVSALKDGMVLKPFYGSTEYIVTNQKVNLQFFYLLKVIGTGGFSKVYLARRKDNGQFYAIKVISKKEMLKKDKEENVFNERNIMTRLHHPFLVKLSYAFQTPEKLFLVMDFCPGGELFYHLSQRRKIREEEAKVYMGEIILALNYLHKNNIIYRDLKPENILLDVDGHLHLADFGLCKVTKSKQDLNYTFCGSPEYMAPEIIKRSGYNFSADFYTLGTLIYEMVVGRPPFIANRNKELYEKILHQEVTYPSHISPNLKMFLSQLLARNPKDRLGSKYGLSEIVNHPWCRDLDFVKIASKKMAAPIVPDISKTNFAREFIDARVSCLEDNLAASLIDAPPSRVPSMYGEGASEMENPAMYRKFANFSFYSNIDDPYEKFQDSIFGSNENTPDTSPKVTRSASKFETVLTPDLLYNAIEKSTAEADNEKKKPLPLPILQGKSSKEDYTDDINEKSPHINNLSEYNRVQTKFIKTSERSMTPRFPGQGLNIEPKKRSEDRKSSLPIFSKQEPKAKRPPLSYYGMNQNSIQTAPDQASQKNKIFLNNSAQSRVPELDLAPKNFDDVSEEIMSRNDKPFTHIDSSRTVYRESQLAHLAGLKSLDSRRTGPRLSGLNNKTYSFMNFEEGAEDPTSDPKSATSNMIPAERFKKPMARALDSERVAPK